MKTQLGQLKDYCDAARRDFSAMDITLIIPATSFGVGEKPPFFEGLEDTPKDAAELIGEYEEAGVTRLIVGMNDMVDDKSFKALEEAAKGLGVS